MKIEGTVAEANVLTGQVVAADTYENRLANIQGEVCECEAPVQKE